MHPPRNRPLCLGAGLLALSLAGFGTAAAQEACDFVDPGNDLLVQRPPFTYVTNPHFRCQGDVEIWADSAVVNSQQSMFLLLGSARYTDGVRELTSVEARYFYEVGRLQAQGQVRVSNREDGSTVENGDLVYLRETEYRDVEEMTFTTGDDGLRPRATVYPQRAPVEADSVELDAGDARPEATDDLVEPEPHDAPDELSPAAEPSEPEEYIVIADRIFFRGDSYFDADGSVEIVRDSLHAFADSAEYTGDAGELLLDGSARVEGSGYDLVGRRITLASSAGARDEIRAREDAVVTGEDLRVTAPQIVLHLVDGDLERMVGVPLDGVEETGAPTEETGAADLPAAADADGAGDSGLDADAQPELEDGADQRPFAVSGDMELTGDSLDLAAPGGSLQRIFAAGSAHSISRTRSELNVEALPEMARQDWIDADTIEVLLVPVGGRESDDMSGASEDYEVERIIARVGARSLYRLEPSDSTAVPGVDPPALSYIVANQITIFMVDGQADRVESVGEVSGWHLEPLSTGGSDPVDEDEQPDTSGEPRLADPDGLTEPDGAGGDVRGDAGAPGA